MNENCSCGQPLHYIDKNVENHMNKLIKEKGRFIAVTNSENMKTYKVDRHYIALHGIMGKDLDKYGFEEITDKNENNS
jgi:hypothetical protein